MWKNAKYKLKLHYTDCFLIKNSKEKSRIKCIKSKISQAKQYIYVTLGKKKKRKMKIKKKKSILLLQYPPTIQKKNIELLEDAKGEHFIPQVKYKPGRCDILFQLQNRLEFLKNLNIFIRNNPIKMYY